MASDRLDHFVSFALITALTAGVTQGVHAASYAVPTYESIGIYWKLPEVKELPGCRVEYRKIGIETWHDGYPLWFDARNRECRGSLVHLAPGTHYEIRLDAPGVGTQTLSASTWAESPPIGNTIYLPQLASDTLVINKSGLPGSYVLYTHSRDRDATIDVRDQHDYNVVISASHIVVRGLKLRGARRHGIVLAEGAHDVIIEDCDISQWGRLDANGVYGVDNDSAIYSDSTALARVTIQRNRIHDPRHGANDWSQSNSNNKNSTNMIGHPLGPQAITFFNSAGNHVIRYNEIFTDEEHCFKDAIGGGDNFSDRGFPNADSDINGNYIAGVCDDAIESEGANRNVRIWDNLIDRTFVVIGAATTSIGPLYVWRNISGRSRIDRHATDPESARCGPFLKVAGSTDRDGRHYGDGQINLFHNTLLQPAPRGDGRLGLGVCWAILAASEGPVRNIVSRNNVFRIANPASDVISNRNGFRNADHDYDLYMGKIDTSPGQERSGIEGAQHFSWGTLAPGVPIYLEGGLADRGVRLPNFNDCFSGPAPDLGALEEGECRIFGISGNGALVCPPYPGACARPLPK
jgi:hypothetical protein